MTNAIPTGDASEAGSADAADMFFKRITDADDAILDHEEDETTEGTDDEVEDEADTDAEEPSDEAEDEDSDGDEEDNSDEQSDTKSKKTSIDLSDETTVRVKVDGVEQEFSLGSLKRLAGQEAALTRKSQEAAEVRKRADEAVEAYAHSLLHLRQKAAERFAPFEGTNLLLMSKHLTAEELAIVNEQANAARADLAFFDQELSTLARKREQEQNAALKAQAEESWKVLSDPQTGIQGWNMNLYNDLLGYMIQDLGFNQQTALTLVDPGAWRVVHDSYLYRKGQKALQTKAKPVAKSPAVKKVIKSSSPVATQKARPDNEAKLMNRLKSSGDADSAADLFLARATRNK